MEFLKEFWEFLKYRKKYWLLPIIIALLIISVVVVVTEGTALSPFIYAIFWMILENKNFKLNDDINEYTIKDPVTSKVAEFYQESPFPNYKIDDNKHTILQIGDNNWLMRELKKFIGYNKLFIEVGSGTFQLSNYLAIGTNNKIYALDSSLQSLKLGKEFAKKNNIQNVNFVRGDIFDKIFKDEVFDFVWCNGVLHHTKNPYEAFKSIIPCLKKNGYIFVGLYNKIGRFRTKFRKYIYKFFGKEILISSGVTFLIKFLKMRFSILFGVVEFCIIQKIHMKHLKV